MNQLKSILAAALLLFALPLAAATFTSNGPTSTNNDDTCDISLMPAATLLVPYFEVDLAGPGRQTTILTITNTSQLPQSVRVTLWTDFGFPVMNFPMFLTGYDVQSINLWDIITRGRIAPDNGTGLDVSPVGELSGTGPEDPFDNPVLQEASCTDLPVQLPAVYITRMRDAFTTGKIPDIGSNLGCDNVGGRHTNAVGYVTIDVVGVCSASLPTDEIYFTNEIRYDNVLIGDYLQIDGENDFAQGSPMVHIRAIPEGGTASTHAPTNLRRTFYSRLQPAASNTRDARQPLPSTFAARWITGGGTGFETYFKIWREGQAGATTACSAYPVNGTLPFVEIVRFDEEENPVVWAPPAGDPPPLTVALVLPATSLTSADEDIFPRNDSGDVAGWMYLNLHDARTGEVAGQNWVVTSMRAEERFSIDSDALALGNGCTAPIPVSNANRQNGQPIGPAPNTTP